MASLVVSHPIFLRPVGRRWQNGAFFFWLGRKTTCSERGFPNMCFFPVGFLCDFFGSKILFKMALFIKGRFWISRFSRCFLFTWRYLQVFRIVFVVICFQGFPFCLPFLCPRPKFPRDFFRGIVSKFGRAKFSQSLKETKNVIIGKLWSSPLLNFGRAWRK